MVGGLVLKPKTTNEGKTTMTRPKLKDDTVTLSKQELMKLLNLNHAKVEARRAELSMEVLGVIPQVLAVASTHPLAGRRSVRLRDQSPWQKNALGSGDSTGLRRRGAVALG